MPKKNTIGSRNPFPKLAEPPALEHEACVVIVSDAVEVLVPFSVTLDGEIPQLALAGSDEHDRATV